MALYAQSRETRGQHRCASGVGHTPTSGARGSDAVATHLLLLRARVLSLGTSLAADSPVYYNVAGVYVAIKEFYRFGGNEPKRHTQRAKGGLAASFAR